MKISKIKREKLKFIANNRFIIERDDWRYYIKEHYLSIFGNIKQQYKRLNVYVFQDGLDDSKYGITSTVMIFHSKELAINAINTICKRRVRNVNYNGFCLHVVANGMANRMIDPDFIAVKGRSFCYLAKSMETLKEKVDEVCARDYRSNATK